MLLVNEVFDTVQGEGAHTGMPATFVRLHGCDVGCPFCDTKYTWHINPAREIDADAMYSKTVADDTYAKVDPVGLASNIAGRQPRGVVITGGEPCIYDLTALTRLLADRKATVAIETSGTMPINVSDHTWVTVSPKIGMPGGFDVRADAVERADEIKWLVGNEKHITALLDFSKQHSHHMTAAVYLQPLSRNKKATDLAIECATKYGWRVSIQVHALIGLR